jgi:hypothetical protein
MSTQSTVASKFSSFQRIAVVLAAVMLPACDGSLRREGQAPAGARLQILRTDLERNRLWVLEREAISLHDNTSGRRLRRIVLPDWIFVGKQYSCPPGLALDADGAAFVTSNVLPALWRIDPKRFEVTRLELALDSDTDKDVGFSGLAFAEDGTLLAAGSIAGSLWRIDTGAASARKIASYPSLRDACDPATLLRASQEQTNSVSVASRPR